MTQTKARSASSAPTPITKTGWEKLGVHTITLPSGAVVKIRIPDLTLLVAGDAVPEQLRAIAFAQISRALGERPAGEGAEPPPMDMERFSDLAGLHRFLISQALVEPALSMDDLETIVLPSEDLMMLAEISTRQRQVDARGVVLGVEPIDRWSLWAQAHECPEDCEHCQEVAEALSSLRR